MPVNSRAQVQQSLSCNQQLIDEILDRLERDSGSGKANIRAERRFQLRLKNCLVSIKQPGASSPVVYVVPTQNISVNGFAFLYQGYVHKGSRCTAHLSASSGMRQDVAGEVVHCQYLESMVHLVGVRFQESADLGSMASLLEPVRVAVYTEDESLVEQVSGALRNGGLVIAEAASVKDLEARLAEAEFDAVVTTAFDMDDETIQLIRARGFNRPLIALGPVSDFEHSVFGLVIEDPEQPEMAELVTKFILGGCT